ncbi:anti-sigma factor domain-containing protein [Actinomyces sp. oral taxon 181]|uniref:anti-sigma factor n=1 Tax=Actinomyces sp. oral taxon 181 TaxID=712121 RepID=UPI00034DE372
MFARVLAAAAAAVALFAAGIGVDRWTTMTSMESTSHYAALNQAQDVRRSTDTMPDGHVVTLTWSPEMGMTAITTPSALRAPEGQVIQVWARHGNTVESLGVYERRGGDYSFVDIMPQPGSEIFLTFEPQGGSAQPTGEPLVVLRVGAPDPAPTPGGAPTPDSGPAPGGAPSPSTAPTWDGGRSSDGQSGAV